MQKGLEKTREYACNGVVADEDNQNTDAPYRSLCSQGPRLGRSQDCAMANAAPSTSGIGDSPGRLPSRRPGTTRGRKNSGNCWVGASAAGTNALGGPTCLTKVFAEGTNPCTQSSVVTKNVFNLLHNLSESIGASCNYTVVFVSIFPRFVTENYILL